jgi:putative spermidine/putrescine transport system permease protein
MILALPAGAYLVVFFLVPVLSSMLLSFHSYDPAVGVGSAFTLDNYVHMFSVPLYGNALLRTMRIALIVTIVTLCLGYPLAYQIAHGRGRGKAFLMFVVLAPVLVSGVIRGLGWLAVTAPGGPLLFVLGSVFPDTPTTLWYTEGLIIVGLVHVQLPFMVLPIMAALRGIPSDVVPAARSLGAGDVDVFRRVIWPMSLPGVVAGSVVVFALVSATYVTPRILGGPGNQVIATLIYQQQLLGDRPFAAALAVMLMAVAALAYAVSLGTRGALARRRRA